MTSVTYNPQTQVTYLFPEGVPEDTLLNIPFKYETKDDLIMLFNDRQVGNWLIDFETEGAIRINLPFPKVKTITIKRLTKIDETSNKETLFNAVQELRDETELIKTDLTSFKTEISEKINLLKGEFNERLENGLNKQILIFSSLIECEKQTHQSDINKLTESIKEIKGSLIQVSSYMQRVQADLTLKIEENSENWQSSFTTLSRDHNALIMACLDDLYDLRQKDKQLEEDIRNLMNKKCECAQPTPPHEAVVEDVKMLDKLVDETRSALNIETQVRRVEDAQIKALLKRLLAKLERLEDFIAGETGGIESNILSELRAEMRKQDDTLGRTHLETIIRMGDLSNRADMLGRTALDNTIRLSRLKEKIKELKIG